MSGKKKSELKSTAFFFFGLIFGLGGGVIGNILVNSSFNLINNSCENKICVNGSIILMISSFIVFLGMTIFLLKQFNKIIRGIIG